MEKIWMTTEQMMEALRNDPDNEHEYTHYLGGCLRSTHWWYYDAAKNEFCDSTDWNSYTHLTEEDVLEIYSGHKWRRDV